MLTNKKKITLNPAQENELFKEEIFFLLPEISRITKVDIVTILHGLRAKNLINYFQTFSNSNDGTVPYLKVSLTAIGIQLFAIANNMFDDWKRFAIVDFGDFDNIDLPKFYGQSLDSLLEKTGWKKVNAQNLGSHK